MSDLCSCAFAHASVPSQGLLLFICTHPPCLRFQPLTSTPRPPPQMLRSPRLQPFWRRILAAPRLWRLQHRFWGLWQRVCQAWRRVVALWCIHRRLPVWRVRRPAGLWRECARVWRCVPLPGFNLAPVCLCAGVRVAVGWAGVHVRFCVCTCVYACIRAWVVCLSPCVLYGDRPRRLAPAACADASA